MSWILPNRKIHIDGKDFPILELRIHMAVIRQNLHNHTLHSDGRFSPQEIIASAISANLEGVGISDHFFTGKVFRRIDLKRYLDNNWPSYLREADAVRSEKSYPLKIWFGIEIDTCFDRIGASLAELPWEDINSLDYALFEYVGEEDIGGFPFDEIARLRDYCKIPIVLAHPNIDAWEDDISLVKIFESLRAFDMAVEIPSGSRNRWFWSKRDPAVLAGVNLTMGSDTHEFIEDVGAIEKTLAFLENHDLIKRLSDPDSMATRQEAV